MSLSTPENVKKLQAALHAKAKGEAAYRFYSLYDKIHRKDVFEYAWKRCRINGGAAGVDAQSFEQIEEGGLERWLEELAKEIREKTYRPNAVRRVWIPGWSPAVADQEVAGNAGGRERKWRGPTADQRSQR